MRGSSYEGAPPPATPAGTPQTERRVALVIGNAAYHPNAPILRNPINDARMLADRLSAAGFADITRVEDAGYQDLRRAVRDFADKADAADMAVIYYAGHGIEVDGQNHLIPTDAILRHERDVAYETLSLAEVMKALEGARKLRLIMLDACRDNPFAKRMLRGAAAQTRSISRGLAELDHHGNVLVAYAAKAGTTASDGTADNSPFAEALAKYIVQPGLEIGFVFRHVRDAVLAATNPKQEPWLYGSLSAEPIYLVAERPKPASPEPATVAWARPVAAPEHHIFLSYARTDRTIAADLAAALESDGYRVEWDTRLIEGQSLSQEIEQRLEAARAVIVIWTAASVASEMVESEARRARDAGKLIPVKAPALDFKAIPMPFDRLHTIGLADTAGIRSALGRLQVLPETGATAQEGSRPPPRPDDLALWDAIQASTDPSDFEDFVTRFQASVLAPNAIRRIRSLVVDCFEAVELELFLNEFPDSPRKQLVLDQIAKIEWRDVGKYGSAERIRAFLARHPNSPERTPATAALAASLWHELRGADDLDGLARFAREFAELPEGASAIARIREIDKIRQETAERAQRAAEERAKAESQNRAQAVELEQRHAADWQRAAKADTKAAYEAFLAAWASGPHVEAASQGLVAAQQRERAAEEDRAREEQQRREGPFQVRVGPVANAKLVKLKPGDSIRDLDMAPEMVLVPPGTFWMGSKDGEGNADERPHREVTIPKPLLVGKYPLTFDEWDAFVPNGKAVAGSIARTGFPGLFKTDGKATSPYSPSDEGWGRGRRPVINVSWNDVTQAYLPWLNAKLGFAADDPLRYRLLSETEWEYCCRAVTSSGALHPIHTFGDDPGQIDAHAWFEANSGGKTHPVGEKAANAFGLHDMHGNDWEWCDDPWHATYVGAPTDGSVWSKNGDTSSRVLRGGSWGGIPQNLRAAIRSRSQPDDRDDNIGFRLARTLNP